MTHDAETFEGRLARLTAVVEELEHGELPLERGMALYKEGLTLAMACRKELETARNEVKIFQDGLLGDFEPCEDGQGARDDG